jgi:hypothetical protein
MEKGGVNRAVTEKRVVSGTPSPAITQGGWRRHPGIGFRLNYPISISKELGLKLQGVHAQSSYTGSGAEATIDYKKTSSHLEDPVQ